MGLASVLRALIPERLKKSLTYTIGSEHAVDSFSQEGEDILLSRILDKSEGFYVDVGAFMPFKFSNTALLYKKGWRGICIEPNPDAEEVYRSQRPEDTFVNCGVSDENSELTYYKYEIAPYNTFSKERVEELKSHHPIEELQIKVRPLAEILDEYCKIKHIDVLSIDVEGLDLKVLKSNNWDRYRPDWIVCETMHDEINDLLSSSMHSYLVSKGYRLMSKLLRSVFYQKFDSSDG